MNTKILTLVLLCASCTTVTPVPDPVTPSVEIYAEACANLAEIGCPEGKDADCAGTMRTVQEKRLVDLKPACLVKATSAEEARACGTVECK